MAFRFLSQFQIWLGSNVDPHQKLDNTTRHPKTFWFGFTDVHFIMRKIRHPYLTFACCSVFKKDKRISNKVGYWVYGWTTYPVFSTNCPKVTSATCRFQLEVPSPSISSRKGRRSFSHFFISFPLTYEKKFFSFQLLNIIVKKEKKWHTHTHTGNESPF